MGAYTDEILTAAVQAEHDMWDGYNTIPPVGTAAKAALDAVAPAIAARAKAEALRELIRQCFDEHDAAVTVGGVEMVLLYVYDTLAELTGAASDIADAAEVRRYAAMSLSEKYGRTS